MITGVVRTEDGVERAGDERVGIRFRLRERMHRLVLQLLALFPGNSAVSRLEKSARLIVAVRADIKNLRVARIDDDVIYEELGFAEVVKQLPLMGAVCRRVD